MSGASSPLPLVLVTTFATKAQLAPLRGCARIITGPTGGNTMNRAEVLKHAPQLHGLITQGEQSIDHELLERAPHLRIVASASVGVDKMDLPLMAQRGVYATNAPEFFAMATADFTLGLIIALLRRLPKADRYVHANRWKGFQPGAWDGTLLHGKTLGLIGYGPIARGVARRATAFGLKTIHYRRKKTRSPSQVPLARLLQTSDIVSVHLPLTAETRHLINAARLRQMKKGAVLLNLGRGPVVEEKALIAALESGRLGGAALDVFEHEPAVPAALRRRDDVILTPHMGGGTRESRAQSLETCIRNVARVLTGETPANRKNRPVNPATS